MKKLILLITSLLFVTFLFSQDTQDVLYLKNGSILRGLIIEQVPNEHIKIMTSDGSIFVNKYSEIEKITKETEEINLNEYGGQYSFGIAIGGGGIVGVPVRYYLNPKIVLELGAYYRPVFILINDNINTSNSIMLAGGTNLYLSKSYNSFKEKVILNGLSFKAGYSYGDYPESMFAVGWAHEAFKKKNKKNSFIFELGAGALTYLSDNYYQVTDGSKTHFLFYCKLNWNWYAKKKISNHV